MIVKDDGSEKGIQRSFFWCMNFPSKGIQVMSQVDEPIEKLSVGDLVELIDPTYVLWEVKSTNDGETKIFAKWLSMGKTIVKIDINERVFITEELIPLIKVQITKESEE